MPCGSRRGTLLKTLSFAPAPWAVTGPSLPLHKLGNALSLHRGGPEPGLHSHELLAGWISWCREHICKGWLCPLPTGVSGAVSRDPSNSQLANLSNIDGKMAQPPVPCILKGPVYHAAANLTVSQRGCVMSGARGRPSCLRIKRLLSRSKSNSAVM